MKVVIDAFGGDNAPLEIIEGAILALNKHKDLEIILCGKENEIKLDERANVYNIEVIMWEKGDGPFFLIFFEKGRTT